MFSLSTYSYSALTYERPHNKVYEYPGWAIAIGWLLACVSVTMIPVVMVIKVLNTGGPLLHVSVIVKEAKLCKLITDHKGR